MRLIETLYKIGKRSMAKSEKISSAQRRKISTAVKALNEVLADIQKTVPEAR